LGRVINHSVFLGKGSISQGNPEFGKERQQTPPFIYFWQGKRTGKKAKKKK